MRIAIVGAGLIGSRRAQVAVDAGDAVAVIADVDTARARALADRTGALVAGHWGEALSADIDAVVIATPNKFAAPVAIAAAGRGCHVLCEKPLGRTLDEASAMVAAARRAGVVLKTGFNHRHHPAVRRAFRLVREGAIGQPMFLRCVYGHGGRPGYDQEWRGNADLAGGGEMLDQGVHVLDLARWFLGDFVEVSGMTARWFWNIAPLEDNGFALLRTAAGQIASCHTSWTQWKNQFTFEVFGHQGYVRIEGLGGSYGVERLVVGRRRPESGPPEQTSEEFSGPDLSWQLEWQEFRDAIRDGREPLANGEDGREVVRLVAAVYESARTGRVVGLAAPSR